MQELKPMDYKENYEGLLPEDSFRISPSMLGVFNDKKHNWFRACVLGESIFNGSTSSVLGSCVHRVAEEFIKLREVNKEDIFNYARTFSDNPDVDVSHILEQITPMGQALIDYLRVFGLPQYSEYKIATKIKDNVYLAGTIDAIKDDIIVDFKTTSDKNPKPYIPLNYKMQLLAYAYAAKKNGMDIQRIRIMWITQADVNRISEKTGKPLKDYPSKVECVTEIITDDDMKFIEDYLNLIADSYLKVKSNPELAYLIFSDYRLKDFKW